MDKLSLTVSIDVMEFSDSEVYGGKIYNPVVCFVRDEDVDTLEMFETDVWLLDPETAAEQVATGLLHAFTHVLQMVNVIDVESGKVVDQFEIFSEEDEEDEDL